MTAAASPANTSNTPSIRNNRSLSSSEPPAGRAPPPWSRVRLPEMQRPASRALQIYFK